MPIEGIPAHTPETKADAQLTSDATVKNTGANAEGTDTQAAQKAEAQPEEKRFTQADLDRHLQTRLKAAVKAELKKLSADETDKPDVDELTRQLSETKQRAQAIEAREAVRDFLSDPNHKLNVKATSVAAIVKLVTPDLEFDDEGKPTNLKDAVNAAKNLAPDLFANSSASINANNGRVNATPTRGMDALIRSATGHGA
jgi:hypothetical protein